MQYLKVFWSLLRYRVAVMLALFTLLAVAFHHGFTTFHLDYLAALLALVFTYVSATSFNDLADEAIDKINHAGKRGRLLVTGEATRRQLATVGITASIGMLLLGALIGPVALLLMVLSLVVNVAYSLPPLRLSYRTYFVPFVLAIGYVLIPFGLGLVLTHIHPGLGDLMFAAALYSLFLARINLKDFRDREGDSEFGKPTLLLARGKPITIMASNVTLWLGMGLLVITFWHSAPGFIVALAVGYGILMSWLLVKLAATKPGPRELVIIGVAAKVGNGLLLSLLAILLLPPATAPSWVLALVLVMLFAGSAANLKFLSQDPKLILESYRG
jgi:4-hydroxybenzoate polyprenyltransferase